ncbi:hypothetical protein VTI74DRAFT_11536 [Chaetomium olivicolor]
MIIKFEYTHTLHRQDTYRVSSGLKSPGGSGSKGKNRGDQTCWELVYTCRCTFEPSISCPNPRHLTLCVAPNLPISFVDGICMKPSHCSTVNRKLGAWKLTSPRVALWHGERCSGPCLLRRWKDKACQSPLDLRDQFGSKDENRLPKADSSSAC